MLCKEFLKCSKNLTRFLADNFALRCENLNLKFTMSCVTVNSTPIPSVSTNNIQPTIITGTNSLVSVTESLPVSSTTMVVNNSAPVAVTTQNSNHTSLNVSMLPPDIIKIPQVLNKQRLQDLVREVDPTVQTDEETDELLLQLAEEFIEDVVETSCTLAKHRKSSILEVKDVQLSLEKDWNMWIPGFGCEEVKPYRKSFVTEAHKQRMSLIRKTLKK
ncbi:hypothetical protein CEXT_174151 [Caerostris extrusa]|uniref:Transcription initiation factor TFIID subunit 12 n=1 Tax=Caerostris extrusa TaxID=172846 RepID=A0AAV4XPP7_CAEEX|nr:hypothetical protein CEXT_174151 [Caerostris extrusa]